MIPVNYQTDEQLRLLHLLYQEEPSQQLTQGNEQQGNIRSGSSEQKSQHPQRDIFSSGIEIRSDPGREQRKGTPEVIFGESKGVTQVIAMAQSLLTGSG